jgi:hypothetical protein
VSALDFNVAQRTGLFAGEEINIEMIAIEGGAANMMAALNRGRKREISSRHCRPQSALSTCSTCALQVDNERQLQRLRINWKAGGTVSSIAKRRMGQRSAGDRTITLISSSRLDFRAKSFSAASVDFSDSMAASATNSFLN